MRGQKIGGSVAASKGLQNTGERKDEGMKSEARGKWREYGGGLDGAQGEEKSGSLYKGETGVTSGHGRRGNTSFLGGRGRGLFAWDTRRDGRRAEEVKKRSESTTAEKGQRPAR